MKPLLIGLVGATGCGKTALSLLLKEKLPIQIVCMDSMQIYRGMDIGTAKPTKKERALVPHHMLDVVDPGDEFSVAHYQAQAGEIIDAILAKGDIPVLVGGTGMYLRSLSLPMTYGSSPADEQVRTKYEAYAQENGAEALHLLLSQKDPPTAMRLHPNDLRRVVRALEVYELTGIPVSAQELPSYDEGKYRFLLFEPQWPRELLYERINLRVLEMIKDGLEDEVRSLLNAGLSPHCQSMQGLGYKEMLPLIEGRRGMDETIEEISRRTRNYAKRQLTWFRADERIRHLNALLPLHQNIDTIVSTYQEATHGH